MKTDLINYIVCPICHSNFTIKEQEENGEIESGILECMQSHRFPIRGGIPRILISSESVEQVKESFSKKWCRFEDTTFSKRDLDFQYSWYVSRYGYEDDEGFKRFLKSKTIILDAGCGVGRAVGWFSNFDDCIVFGVDFSEAIDISHKHYGGRKNVHLIQADIRALPFRENTFNYISCDQVIHHTPEPEETFVNLTRLLKGGGEIAVYVYRKKGPIREFCDDYIRERTTKMSVDECLKFSEAVTNFGKALADLDVKISIPEDIPIIDIKAGTHNLQRLFYWNIFKCFWDEEGDYERSLAVNFDWYHPKYAHRFTPEEIKGWFEKTGLMIQHFSIIESGISGRGMKV